MVCKITLQPIICSFILAIASKLGELGPSHSVAFHTWRCVRFVTPTFKQSSGGLCAV